MTLATDIQRILAVLGSDTDAAAYLHDEHLRYELYIEALAAASGHSERELLQIVVRDPDVAMREAAVVAHVNEIGKASPDAASLEHRLSRVADVVGEVGYARRRADEWIIAKNAAAGEDVTAAVLSGTDWLQRKAAEVAASSDVLAALASGARTKRVRNRAALRLREAAC